MKHILHLRPNENKKNYRNINPIATVASLEVWDKMTVGDKITVRDKITVGDQMIIVRNMIMSVLGLDSG